MSDRQHDAHSFGQGMSDVQSQRGQPDKSREDLLDDLADLLEGLDTETDVDALEACLQELEQYGELAPDFDETQALNDLYKKYESYELVSSNTETPKPSERKSGKSKAFRYTARIAVIAAIIGSLIAGAQAVGIDIFEIIARWTSGQFYLERTNDPQTQVSGSPSEGEYQSLQEALDAYGIQAALAPTYLPEGAVLESLTTHEEKGALVIMAKYTLPDGRLSIGLRQNESVPLSEVEKDTDDINVYTVDGITHYIMQDISRQKAVWCNDIWECLIVGDISREDLLAMIDSIYN